MATPFIICIIDDDEVYQFTATRIIKASIIPKKILIFSDGEQAIQFLAANLSNIEEVPDVIFLDINMPVMDGWLFLEEYVKIKPSIGKKVTIYMISSSVDSADINKASKISEISDYIVKPITTERLKEIIAEIESRESRS